MYDCRVDLSKPKVESLEDGSAQVQVEVTVRTGKHPVPSDVVDCKHSALSAKDEKIATVGLHRHSYKSSATTM